MSSLLLFFVLFVFLLLSGLFSLAERAALTSNRHRIQHLASQGSKRAKKLAAWLDAPQRLLAALSLGNNFANIGAATVAATIIVRMAAPGERGLYLAAQTVVLTFVVLLFCELGPRVLATRSPERTSLFLVVPMELWMRMTGPVTRLGLGAAEPLPGEVRETPGRPLAAAEISDAELKSIINSYTEDRRMLERVLEFTRRPVRDVMVPRMKAVSLDIDMPLEEILRVVETTRLTRFPVYQGNLDNVLGIMHGKDLMPYLHRGKPFRLSQLLRKPVFIPDTARLNNAVRVLQSAQTHLGIVVDEHGGVEGIVTLEDLIEQIVGEIQDEHDIDVDEILPQPNGSFLVDASISVRTLNERLHLNVPENGYYVTLGGYVMMKTGQLPHEGDAVELEDHVFQVEQVVGRRIMRVRITRRETPEPGDAPVEVRKKGAV